MKKFLCAILAFALVFCFSACGEESDEITDIEDVKLPDVVVSDTDLTLASPTPTPVQQELTTLAICGVNLIRDGHLTGLAFGGCVFENGVLTITDTTLSSSNSDEPIIAYSGGDLDIVLVGTSTFTATNGAAIISCTDESTDDGDLEIEGAGNLVATAEGTAAISVPGDVSISASVDITGEPAVESLSLEADDGAQISENSETHLVVYASTANM